ncbi:MAG: acyltransferase [Candidatus Nanopelagicales bacterium]|nr:acyltransferase [Candidatus Nanopelagicales bacterium]
MVASPWNLDRGRAQGEMGYLPGLDGLRALAIGGVLLYHAGFDPVPGGFLGVDVFFVLSGFLITSLILEQFTRTGTINFKQFYLGRARRLLPALFLMLAVVGLAVALVYRDSATSFRADALASIFYVNNWWYIFADHSYFEFTGRPALLNHLWSLAVEEQFYLIWPFIAFLVIRKLSRRALGFVALGGALASTAWMFAIATSQAMPEFADPSRAYFGADSHAMGLLIGAALATVWRPGRLPLRIAPRASLFLTTLGVTTIALIVGFYLLASEFSPFLYRGGFLVLAVIVAATIALATHPALPLGAWLGIAPLRYLGQRSYGIYLWHWPIFMVTRPDQDIPLDGLPLFILRMILTLGIAELSFRFVEMPIRRGALGRTWQRLKSGSASARERIVTGALALVTAIVVVGTVMALALVPSTAAIAPDVAAAIGTSDEVLIDATPTPSNSASNSNPQESVVVDTEPKAPLSVIGDSVVLGARGAITDAIPGTTIDAAVSRFPGGFIGRVKKLSRKEELANTVAIHPGTNGVMPESMLRDLLDQLVDYDRVILVNSSMPRSWEKPNNAVIDKVAPDYPNVVVADWKETSRGNSDYFVSDKVHLTAKGARAFAQLIRDNMLP